MSVQPKDALTAIRESQPGGLTLREYQSLARNLSEARLPLDPVRVVFLASYTTQVLEAYLRVEGARHGFAVDVHHGAFGQFEQELAAAAWMGRDDDDPALVLAMRLEDLHPGIQHRFYARDGTHESLIAALLERIDGLITTFRQRSAGPVMVANFAPPEPPPLRLFDAGTPGSLTLLVSDLNRRLADRLASQPGCHVWDYAGLVAGAGRTGWTDPRLWALGRIPVAAHHQPVLAAHLMRTLRATLRPSAKCLVVDLDGVLWGGVLGDDGVEGLELGDEHPGLAHKEFQRAILGLRDRGILLAICSKNDEELARQAITTHPEMIVSLADFAALRINWSAKSANLREIADELSVGLDSIVFFDDNSFERGEVARALPMVCVPTVPADPVEYVRALADVAVFDASGVTSEDRGRAVSYQASRNRRVESQDTSSIESFLASLEMRASIGSLGPLTSQRIAQLVAKTNQFNLTTRRQSQAELEMVARSDDQAVYWLRLADRHGDLGLIAVAVVRFEYPDAVIHNLVLSCRAANRGVEQTLVAHVAEVARARGCANLVGEYIPTARNHVVAGLYSELGFEPENHEGEVRRFRLELGGRTVGYSPHLDVNVGPTVSSSGAPT
jgi:FkbH-like protein